MTLKKSFSLLLALTLILGVFAPCVALNVSAQTALYGEADLEQVTEPVIGESYYLGADVEGTMMYFRHGTVTDTVPYSLVTTDNINHNWCFKLTLEDSTATDEKFEGGFQFAYENPTSGALTRIYCMDVLKDATVSGQTGIMDTGLNTTTPYKNRHSFHIDEIEGVKVLRKYGNNNVLVIKQVPQTVDGEEKLVWRMLGVAETELGNDGVYPVMLLQEHEHTYGNAAVDAENNTASRTCTACGYVYTVYDSKLAVAEKIEVGNEYYLAANVDGDTVYVRSGSVTETAPYSLPAMGDVNHSWVVPMTFAAPVEGSTGFQITFIHPTSGKNVGIYCYDVGGDGTVDTGVNTTPALNTHTYFVDTVNGVRVLRCLGNHYVLAIKRMEQTVSGEVSTGWRMLGVSEDELSNEGVYPVIVMERHEHTKGSKISDITDEGHSTACWCGGDAAEEAHVYGNVTADTDNNTYSRTCTVCGYTNVTYGEAHEQVKYPAVGETYYLAANVAGVLKYFTKDGAVTATAPYSLSTTERNTVATTVTLENSTATSEKFEGGFQFTFDNNGTLTRIYCMDVLKDATTAGQTGIMDTGTQSGVAYKNRHSFFVDEVNGVKVLRKYGNNNILVVKLNETTNTYRMLGVPETELANAGVYPVVLLDTHEHTYGVWSFDEASCTQSQSCTVCGHTESLHGTGSTKVSFVTEPVIDESYYLAANVAGVIKFFTTGTVTNTAPYSLVTTERVSVAVPVALEDSMLTSEKFEGGFQFTFDNNGTLTRIYCMDVLKDATTAGQTGIMDTGTQSGVAYKNRHSFFVDEVNGVKVLRKYGNNNILVVKLNETTNTYRMLGVPEAELANAGVYPVMLANAHTHTFGEELYGDASGHWHLCDCGSKSTIEAHTVESWTVVTPPSETELGSKTGVCTVCGETAVSEMEVAVESWNVVLSDKIGVNFALALTEGDSVCITVGGNEVPVTVKKDGTAFVELAAAQMADEIVIIVNNYTVDKTYCVRDYADVILAGDYTSYTKALVENMLSYGGAAQTYFGHNTENLANEGIEVSVEMPSEAPELEVINELTGVKYYGASVLHQDKTAVRFYFVADSVDGLTFMVDGNVYEPVSKNGMFYIEVADINPQNLADNLNVLVTDGTGNLAVQYSPLTYMVRMYHKTGADVNNKALVQAMYGYYMAAKNYMANLGLADDFAVKSVSESTLYEGVTLSEKVYVAAGYGEVEAYILTVKADANVELKVSAGAWDETNNGENPAEAKTVANHFRSVKNAGNSVLAMINGGFFDLTSTGSNLPYGAQVVDGVEKQAPSADANNYSNNWFGMTTEGKYVISDAAGYESGKIQQAVGGGKLLIVDGVPVGLTSGRDYRTAVGVNANGDLVMVAVANATYSDLCHIFVDMGLDITTVLNLDGGGSTAMYVPGAYYPKALILGEDGILPRKVADAVAIVAKQ